MSDFKWEMQQRIDQGMNPDQAYHATRESYADAADLARKRRKEDGITEESNPDEYAYLRLLQRKEEIDGHDEDGPDRDSARGRAPHR